MSKESERLASKTPKTKTIKAWGVIDTLNKYREVFFTTKKEADNSKKDSEFILDGEFEVVRATITFKVPVKGRKVK